MYVCVCVCMCVCVFVCTLNFNEFNETLFIAIWLGKGGWKGWGVFSAVLYSHTNARIHTHTYTRTQKGGKGIGKKTQEDV